jgi:hypothetical protein
MKIAIMQAAVIRRRRNKLSGLSDGCGMDESAKTGPAIVGLCDAVRLAGERGGVRD